MAGKAAIRAGAWRRRRGPCIDPAHPVPEFSIKQKRRLEEAEKEKREPRLF